eukprot:scaffold91913_cov103-Phaeocystis_antarctica.AAC.1
MAKRSIERARRKPTPKIASDCTEVQPCSARRLTAQKCSPATRDAVDASIAACGTQSHRAGTAKADAEDRATRIHRIIGS